MKYEITKSDILKAYEDSEILKELFPEAFESKEMKIGKWYWVGPVAKQTRTFLYCYQGEKSYGFGWDSQWTNNIESSGPYIDEIPATNDEVEAALLNEALRRGYKNGVKCLFGSSKYERIIKSNDVEWCPYWGDTGGLAVGSDIIFSEGKWAEIV